jgi:hypothetical protein
MSAHVQFVVDDTAVARTLNALGTPPAFISSAAKLALDWLDVPPPVVETVDAPALSMPATFADALPMVIVAPALGRGPVSLTAVVAPGPTPVITVALRAVARPLNNCASIAEGETIKLRIAIPSIDIRLVVLYIFPSTPAWEAGHYTVE